LTSTKREELATAIQSDISLEEIVRLLREYKSHGVTREEVYSLLESLRDTATNEQMEDRILEVADFVAGFCSAHMKIWEN
jgi:hypothetical protein